MYKKFAFLLLVSFFSLSLTDLSSQTPSDFFKAVGAANYNLIESYLGNEVDVCINEDQQLNPKSKAYNRLKTFLSTNIVDKVEPLHTGSSKGKNSEYKVAKITTKKGIFRLFVYSETTTGKTFVKEVRIEKFNG
jgi:hypothetical protein